MGRTVCGLPLMSAKFAVLPPQFGTLAEEEKKTIEDMVSLLFPDLPVSLSLIVKYVLSSLLWHFNWLRSILSIEHCILRYPIFRRREVIDIAKKIVVKYAWEDEDDVTYAQATSIPPHVVILAS